MGAPCPAKARNYGVQDSSAIPDPLGGKALRLLMEVYEWLWWATSGTNRGFRTRPVDAVLLRSYGGNREVPLGGPWPGRTMTESSGQ